MMQAKVNAFWSEIKDHDHKTLKLTSAHCYDFIKDYTEWHCSYICSHECIHVITIETGSGNS